MKFEIEVPDGPFCARQLPEGKDGKPAWHRCEFVQSHSAGEAHSCGVFHEPLKEAVYADVPVLNKCAACHNACREAELAKK